MNHGADNSFLPRITIFAESGPLAGDLAACLSGRFRIARVTDRAGALETLTAGCRALLIMGRVKEDFGPEDIDLVKQAVRARCRVLILGAGGLGLGPDLDQNIVLLPPLPSPQLLFAKLGGLEPGLTAGAS